MTDIQAFLQQAFSAAIERALGAGFAGTDPVVRCANDSTHGDWQANFAMSLAKRAGRPPRAIAEAVVAVLDLGGIAATGIKGAKAVYTHFDRVVSLGTLDDFPADTLADHPRHIRIPFDDIDCSITRSEASRMGFVHPTLDHLKEILAFSSSEGTTLVHCREGESRSTAVAILMALRFGAPLEPILFALNPSRINPNRLIILLGEEALNLPIGSLARPLNRHLDRDSSPYHPES